MDYLGGFDPDAQTVVLTFLGVLEACERNEGLNVDSTFKGNLYITKNKE